MAKFVTDDGKAGISGDRLMNELHKQSSSYMNNTCYLRKHHTDVDKLKIPCGKDNRHRLNNMNLYDMLIHIQQTLSLTGRCIIEMITNEDHKCPNMNDDILRRINCFATNHITDHFREKYPRININIKKEGTENEFISRPETDEEWNERICHMYIHQEHPSKIQMFKCEECLQKWLNDDKW